MIGLDTNVLVRYIVQDDVDQAAAATRLIEKRCTEQAPGFVGIPVLVELVWVLTAAYDYEREVVASVVGQLLRTAELTVEDAESVWLALRDFEAGSADFADCLIAQRNHALGCETTYTFDRRATRERYFSLVP